MVVGSSLQYKGERGLPGLYIASLPLTVAMMTLLTMQVPTGPPAWLDS